LGDAPPFVQARADGSKAVRSWSGGWVSDQATVQALPGTVAAALAPHGIILESLTTRADSVEVRVRLGRNDNGAQAIGRTARVLTATMPGSVERFEIVPLINGLPLAKAVIARSDMETLEFAADQVDLMRQRSEIQSAGPVSADAIRLPGIYPKLTYGFSPYLKTSVFDPDSPLRGDVGVRFSAKYEMAPGLTLSGSVTKKLIGNLDQSTRVSNSVIKHVRSDSNLYDKHGDPALETLTLAWHAKPGKDIYTRVTAGYLERMFGGVSAEVLWKPVDSRLAVGAELNYVKQRDFDQGFGFTGYSVLTGHVSGYYTFNNGFAAQLDVGRYLAGDVGATLTVDREFANGWRVGAFATLTDVSFNDFGEGSFDKGIRLRIPLSWASGRASAKVVEPVLRPILRDGGARLEVQDRLYDQVRSKDAIRLDDQWGRFWR
jgi:Exopolysaccharide biosynthesis protein YbjH